MLATKSMVFIISSNSIANETVLVAVLLQKSEMPFFVFRVRNRKTVLIAQTPSRTSYIAISGEYDISCSGSSFIAFTIFEKEPM